MNVRFPTGLVLEYPQAGYITYEGGLKRMYTRKDGDFVALLPEDVVAEASGACPKVYDSRHEDFMRWAEQIHPEIYQEYLTTKLVASKLNK